MQDTTWSEHRGLAANQLQVVHIEVTGPVMRGVLPGHPGSLASAAEPVTVHRHRATGPGAQGPVRARLPDHRLTVLLDHELVLHVRVRWQRARAVPPRVRRRARGQRYR